MHPAPRLPRKTRLAAAVERQHGMSLLEVSIGLAAAAALATAVFLIYRPSDVTAAVKQEQSNLQDLSTSVERSYGLLGSFEDVTQGRLLTDRLVPASMLRSDGALRHRLRARCGDDRHAPAHPWRRWLPTPDDHRGR